MGDWTIDNTTGTLNFRRDSFCLDCSFEIGDWLSTVSAGNNSQSATHTVVETSSAPGVFEATHRVNLSTGSARIDQSERFDATSIRRQFRVVPDGSIHLGDFVIRFVCDTASVNRVEIDDQMFEHRGQNRYLQFMTDSVELTGPAADVRITLNEATGPSSIDPVIYVRDEPPDNWVIHVRALTTVGDGFLRLYHGPIKHSPLLDRVIGASESLKCLLWYAREQSSVPGRLVPVQYVHSAELSGSDEVSLDVGVDLNSTSEELP